MPQVSSVHHLALTVSDLSRSGPWYEKLFEGTKIMGEDEGESKFALYLTPAGFMFGLQQHAGVPAGDRFSELRCGLDHVAFTCASRAEVDEWQKRLDELGVQHSGITDAPYGHVLVFRDPDNIQLEFFALPS